MATWDEVRALALSLPGSTERPAYGMPAWRVAEKMFAWDRPLRRGDLDALGTSAPRGPVLGFYVEDIGEKAAVLAESPELFFTIPHLDTTSVVLGRLGRLSAEQLDEAVVTSWLCRAPRRLVRDYLDARGGLG